MPLKKPLLNLRLSALQGILSALLLVAMSRWINGADRSFKILSYRTNVIAWTNAITNGICSVEIFTNLSASWQPGPNAFTTNKSGQLRVPSQVAQGFYCLRLVDVSATGQGFTNLTECYGILETIAGKGEYEADYANYWLNDFEGGDALQANLSRPHVAMADPFRNIFIADKNSHSILKVTTDGTIHTVGGHMSRVLMAMDRLRLLICN